MKKINSIGYGHKIIGSAALFLMGIPLCLYMLNFIFHAGLIFTLIQTSLIIGLLIVLFLISLLFIELRQDKKINRQYGEVRKKKLPLGNGIYECQSCGGRHIVNTDKTCGVCGITFTPERN